MTSSKRGQVVGKECDHGSDVLLTHHSSAGKSACVPNNDGRDMGSWVSASPAVRHYRTSSEAVRSPRRLGKPARTRIRQVWRARSRLVISAVELDGRTDLPSLGAKGASDRERWRGRWPRASRRCTQRPGGTRCYAFCGTGAIASTLRRSSRSFHSVTITRPMVAGSVKIAIASPTDKLVAASAPTATGVIR